MIPTYVDWLISLIYGDEISKYYDLCLVLNSIEFRAVIPRDMNREMDGERLRMQYFDNFGDTPFGTCENCSVLEMMVALAVRCEHDLMYDVREGDRTAVWFEAMVHGLQLGPCVNGRVNHNYVRNRVDIFINREYDYDGQGGMFPLINPPCDQRTTEIWYQMNYYLGENFDA